MPDNNSFINNSNQEIPVVPTPGSESNFPQDTNEKKHRTRFFKPGIIIVVVLALIGLAAFLIVRSNKVTQTDGNSVTYQTAEISIGNTGINPAVLKIKAGTMITWTNKDTATHQIVADEFPEENAAPDFDSTEVLNQNDSLSYVFAKPGTFNFHDESDPNLKHTVIVE